jgi:hypothetical protein
MTWFECHDERFTFTHVEYLDSLDPKVLSEFLYFTFTYFQMRFKIKFKLRLIQGGVKLTLHISHGHLFVKTIVDLL